MEVRWSEAAAEDLERICEWIDRDDPEAACRVARTIYEQCGRLRDFPTLDEPAGAWLVGASLRSRHFRTSLSIKSIQTRLRSREFSTVRNTGLSDIPV
jgi:plasmid stabilization system protein ParE